MHCGSAGPGWTDIRDGRRVGMDRTDGVGRTVSVLRFIVGVRANVSDEEQSVLEGSRPYASAWICADCFIIHQDHSWL